MVLGNAGAAQVIEQKDVTAQDMIRRIEELYEHRGKLTAMALAASGLAVRDTDERIWNVIERVVKNKK